LDNGRKFDPAMGHRGEGRFDEIVNPFGYSEDYDIS